MVKCKTNFVKLEANETDQWHFTGHFSSYVWNRGPLHGYWSENMFVVQDNRYDRQEGSYDGAVEDKAEAIKGVSPLSSSDFTHITTRRGTTRCKSFKGTSKVPLAPGGGVEKDDVQRGINQSRFPPSSLNKTTWLIISSFPDICATHFKQCHCCCSKHLKDEWD